MNINEYKFVVVKPRYGNVYDYCYKDLENLDNVDLLNDYIEFKSELERKIYYKHFTKKYNLPFRSFWNHRYYKTKFNKDENLVFILSYIDENILKYGSINRLKRKFKNSKFCLFFSDLVKTKLNEDYMIKAIKLFNIILSFDFNDCKKLNLVYNPLVYSAPKVLEKC